MDNDPAPFTKKQTKKMQSGTVLTNEYGDAYFVTRSAIFDRWGCAYSHGEFAVAKHALTVAFVPEDN